MAVPWKTMKVISWLPIQKMLYLTNQVSRITGDVKLPEGKTLVISKIFKALNDRSSKFEYKKDYDGETFECDLYDEVFKAIANANKGDEFFAKRYLIDERSSTYKTCCV